MANESILYRSSIGLNNATDPARLQVNLETGETELSIAVDIDHKADGEVSRRKGYAKKVALNAGCGFAAGGDCLFLSEGTLYRLHKDYTVESLKTGLLSDKASFLPFADRIYYTNGSQHGYVYILGAHGEWTDPIYVGKKTDRNFTAPPVGHLLSKKGGRILVAKDNYIFCSDPFFQHGFDLASNVLIESSRITMIRSVDGGTFVGTNSNLVYYEGDDILNSTRIVKLDDGPIPGTDTTYPAGLTHPPEYGSTMLIWTGRKDIYASGDKGFIQPLTKNRLVIPSASSGTGIIKDNNYIVLLR